MNRDKLLSCLNISYYRLIIVLTILSIFLIHFESGLPRPNEKLDKIIVCLSSIMLFINIISIFLKNENRIIVFKNIIYDICSIFFILTGGVTWIYFLIGFLYFIIPINGIKMNLNNNNQ